MSISVLFFGATAEITAQRRVEVELSLTSKARDVFEMIIADHPLLAKHRLHFSINQEFASGNEILTDGDELAIFTAVSGG